jgi:3-isopropylmalate/(R)-2-methylmalate dehydratase large subunit
MQPDRPRTIYDKIWESHQVVRETDAPGILYIDLHLVHEVTSPQAFAELRHRNLAVRRPDLTVATLDHSIPTLSRSLDAVDASAAAQVRQLETNCREFGLRMFGLDDPRQGIVHVIGPELGLTQPGRTVVCGDSHTSTHGAFGALAFGIGTTEVAQVLATQCLLARKSRNFLVRFDGTIPSGVTAKDMILALIGRVGTNGGTGFVFEYAGSAIRALDMEARMTICNMSIEAGARSGLIAPDDTTFEYLAGRNFAPSGHAWDAAMKQWNALPSDEGAEYDREIRIDAASLEPMITFGTNPGMSIPLSGRLPDPATAPDTTSRAQLENALRYMSLQPRQSLAGHPIQVVFIGSCTNGRLSDLREAAKVLRGRRVHAGVKALVVPGSVDVKKRAEAEGLDRIFKNAGAEWREPGCSMCIAMNGDQLQPGEAAVSTSNRNFEGRQGPGSRTFLASPLTAAASAVEGRIADARRLVTP